MKYNIKNKNFKLVALLLVSSFGALQSCDDIVDVKPISSLSSSTFFKDNSQLNSGLIAAYDGMQESYATHYLRWGEFRSDNVAPAITATDVTSLSINNSTMDPGDTGILRWNELYQCIDRANRVINSADALPGADSNILAQALAIRAKVYFDMTRVWGALPLFTSPAASVEDAFRSRTPSSDIIDNVVIPDMIRANDLISTVSSPFAFSKSSILALMAEVYMSQNTPASNALAKDALTELIGLGSHSLVTSPAAWQALFFNQTPTSNFPDAPGKLQEGPELIFSLRYEPPIDATPSTILPRYAGGAKNIVIDEQLEESWIAKFPIDSTWNDLYPTTPPVFTREVLQPDGLTTIQEPLYGDWRYFLSREGGDVFDGVGNVEIGNARIHKWQKDRQGLVNNLDNTDLVIYRYADIVLLLAEVELKLGDAPAALDHINDLRTARLLPEATTTDFGSTPADQLNYILEERRLELLGEGKRWWDLVRNGLVEQTMNPIIEDRIDGAFVPITPNRILWPILSEHLIDNPNLSQNPEW